MKRTRIILLGVVLLSVLTFAACGSKTSKENKEGEKKECCEKSDSTNCEKKCMHASDSSGCKHDTTGCEKKCEHHADSTRTE